MKIPAKKCVICGRTAADADLVWLRALKGPMCRPGQGCGRNYPVIAEPGHWVDLEDLDDILVDNPKH